MRSYTVLLALLLSGCDAISGVAGEFRPAPLVKLEGVLQGACVRLVAAKEGSALGSWSGCTAPYDFRVNLPDGAYSLQAQAEREGLVYQEGRAEAVLKRGSQTSLTLGRKRVEVQVTAVWLDERAVAVAEAWMLREEAAGASGYLEEPPPGLDGRVLVAREVGSGGPTLSVPTGRDVAFRLVQGEQQGVARIGRLEAGGRVVVP